MKNIRKTKILCTIGPKTAKREMLLSLIKRGMDGVRINTAHGTVEEHEHYLSLIHALNLPVILDIKGPEIRVSVKKPLPLKKGCRFTIGFSDSEPAFFSYDFYNEIANGDNIFFDDGRLKAKVVSKQDRKLELRAENDWLLTDRKHVSIPRKKLHIPSLSEKDYLEINIAKKTKAEFVALSFTRIASDVLSLRKLLPEDTKIIAKIENREGVANFDSILAAADGIMVARGDLGTDLGQEKVPLLQKSMICRCNQEGKIAIVATQLLETMIVNPFPTRAETSDVANAILDGTDVLMLSGETAIGSYPIQAVETLSTIAQEVEPAVLSKISDSSFRNISDAISKSINTIANSMPLDKIVTITRSGYTARAISRFRLKQPIIAVMEKPMVQRQLMLTYGVEPIVLPKIPDKRRIIAVAAFLLRRKLLSKEDTVLFTAGVRTSQKNASNLIEIHKIRELLAFL